jgi:hypothetical protein
VRFKTLAQVDLYFGGRTIKCLLCGQRFQRLGSHLRHVHTLTADEYRAQFGLPWTRSLTATPSRQRSGQTWNFNRRREAQKIAKQTRFFETAHAKPRRDSPQCVKRTWIKNLGC